MPTGGQCIALRKTRSLCFWREALPVRETSKSFARHLRVHEFHSSLLVIFLLNPCYFVLVLCAAIGGADRALHVEGNGGTLHVSPDDHGCREDNRRRTHFGTAPC